MEIRAIAPNRYVAVTRARRRLFLTGHALHQSKLRRPSRFFGLIGDDWVEKGSTRIAREFRGKVAG